MSNYFPRQPTTLQLSQQTTTTSTINPIDTLTAMKNSVMSSKMSSKKTKSHVFSTHKRNFKQPNTRVRNRVMSMESLTARLELVPNRTTAPTVSSSSGIEMRAIITSSSTTFTDDSDVKYQAYSVPATDKDPEAIVGAIVKPTSVGNPLPLNVNLIPGAVRLALEGVSFNLDGSDGYSTPLSEVSTAKDSTSYSSLVVIEKASDGGEYCDSNENADNDDEKSEYDDQHRRHTPSQPPVASQTINNNKHVALQNHQAAASRCTRVGLPPLSVTPTPGTALGLLGPSVPIAFLPTYTNEIKIASIEPHGVPEVPAYARPSMSSWFSSPANSSIHGTVQGPPLQTIPRRTHRAQARPFARNENEITPREMPKVPKEGPTPWVKRLPMYKAVVVSGFDKK